jgi:hypothetical protein
MTDRVNQWFAAMVTGMAAQGWQRCTIQIDGAGEQCSYRRDDGFKCPVGMILPADSPILVLNEMIAVASLSLESRLAHLGLGDLVGREYFFLVEAQRAHDGVGHSPSPEEMKQNFRKLADVYHIELPIELKEETKP